MADRYWVGGTASWDGTAGTKWATMSGGSGGASVPTTDDDVFFTNLSTGTCTIAIGNTGAKSINCTGFTGTIAGIASISVAGSITLAAGQTYSHTGTVTLTGTGTLTTAGKTFSNVTVDGVGITVTLGDALNIGGRTITVTNGTFTTSASNYNVTAGTLNSSNSNTRTITLGSSTLLLSGSSGPINFTTSTNLTFNANTSQINLNAGSPTINGGGQTFYNLSFTGTTTGTRNITGANTFNNLTSNASATGLSTLSLAANQTVNGTFTCAGTSGIARAFVRSDTIGTTRTITANAISANDCDFRDITLAGTAAGASPTRVGDCGGNSGITFPEAKTVYWNPAAAASLASASWATSSGSTTLSTNNFPLAQDTAVFDNSSRAGVSTNPSGAEWNIGTIDMSNRTTAFSFVGGNSGFTVYKNWSTGTGVTITSNVTYTFSGRNTTQTITSNGVAFAGSITVDNVNSTVQLADAISLPQTFTLTRGTLDLANLTLTCGSFQSSNTNTRAIQFGTGNITTTGSATAFTTATATGLTYTGTPTVNISNNSATATIVSPHSSTGGTEANAFDFNFTTGSYALTLTNPNIRNLAFTGGTISWSQTSASCTFYGSVTLLAGMTYTIGTNAWVFAATSGVQTITSAGKTLGPITQNGVGGTVRLPSGTTTLATTATYTLTNGTLDLGTNTSTLSCGTFSSSNSNTRAIQFGTGNITTTGSGTVWSTSTATNLTYTGTPTVNISNNSATATTVTTPSTGGTEANAFDFNFTTGSYALTLTTGGVIRNLAFTGGTITWSPSTASCTFYGSVTLLAGMTYTAGSGTWTFAATSGTQTITHASKTLGAITQNGVGGTFQVQSGMTLATTATYILTAGTLDLGTNTSTLSCGAFSSSNSNTRAIQFGTGNITTTGSGTVWSTTTATGLTYTGTPTVNISNNSATATTVTAHSASGTEANAFDFNFTTGSYALTLTTGSRIRNLAFTGGTITWSPSTASCTFYGNLTLLAGMTYTAGSGTWTFAATSGTQVITSAGKTLGAITQNGVGGTVQLAAGTTTLDVARTYTLTAGTLDLGTNTATLSCGAFSSSNSNTRVIIFGTGNITTTGSGTAWTTATATGLTYTGTPTVNISNNSATATTVTAHTTDGTEANAFDFNFTTGSYALTLTSTSRIRNLAFTGGTITWSPGSASATFYGSVTLLAGMTYTAAANPATWTFAATSGVQTITSAGKTLGPITINNTGTSVQLVGTTTGAALVFAQGTLDINSVTTSFTTLTCATGPSTISGGTLNCTTFTNTSGSTTIESGTLNLSSTATHTAGTVTLGTSGTLTAASAYTLTAGSIVLGSNTLTTTIFSSSNSNVRSIDFGTGQITLTGSNLTIWNTSTATNFTWSGTAKIVSNYSDTLPRTFDFGSLTVPFTVGSGSGNQVSFGTAGIGSVVARGSMASLDFTGFTGTWAQGSLPISITSGNLTLVSGMTTTNSSGTISFTATSGTQVITSAGKTINPITINGVGGTVQLADNTIINDTCTLTNGTLDLGTNTATLSCGAFVSSNSNTRVIQFGTGNITVTCAIVNAFSTATATNLTYTGTPTVNISNPTAISVTVNAHTTGGTAANAFDFNVSTPPAGSYTLTLTSASVVRNLAFTGGTGIIVWAPTSATYTFYGSVTLLAGALLNFQQGTSAWTFAATSGTQTITSAGKTLYDVNKSGVGGTLSLADNLTLTNTLTLTSGTLNLGNNTLSARTFFAGDQIMAIQFGTGNITINSTAGGTVWDTSNASQLTHTGTPTVNISCNTATATGISIYIDGTAPAENTIFDFNFTTGTYVLTTDDGLGGFDGYVGSFNFTGFAGTYVLPSPVYFYRNLTLVSGMTFTHSNKQLNFIATSGTQTITSAGKTLYDVNKSGVGGTLSLADNLTLDRRLDLISGTFNANNRNVTARDFNSNYSNTRTLTMGSGTWTLTGAGFNLWNLATTTGLTVNADTSTIVLSNTSTTARTFAGGGLTYNNLTIGGATGTSTLSISGNNTFNTLASTKTVAHTISFGAGTTTTVANWTITGTAGNVVTLNSATPGSQATLTKTGGGVINGIDYLSIQDLNATPESTWYAGANSTNVSNNAGWVFPAPSNSNFFMMF